MPLYEFLKADLKFYFSKKLEKLKNDPSDNTDVAQITVVSLDGQLYSKINERAELIKSGHTEKAQLLYDEIETLIANKKDDSRKMPQRVIVTFQSIKGRALALQKIRARPSDQFEGKMSFSSAMSPHSLKWENLDVDKGHRWTWIFLFILFYAGWIMLCLYVMILVKFYMENMHFNYYFTIQCPYIQAGFEGQQASFLSWAEQDKAYLKDAQTTGNY